MALSRRSISYEHKLERVERIHRELTSPYRSKSLWGAAGVWSGLMVYQELPLPPLCTILIGFVAFYLFAVLLDLPLYLKLTRAKQPRPPLS